jgi:hypothetical protein
MIIMIMSMSIVGVNDDHSEDGDDYSDKDDDGDDDSVRDDDEQQPAPHHSLQFG